MSENDQRTAPPEHDRIGKIPFSGKLDLVIGLEMSALDFHGRSCMLCGARGAMHVLITSMFKSIYLTVALFLVSQIFFAGCAHKKDVKALTLDELQSKRVALAEIEGAAESKNMVEVAIINEILEKGRFEVVDRKTVKDALATYPTERDWKRLGEKLGADYIMSIRISEFKVDEHQGYDAVEEVDSVLTEESGESKPVVGKRYVKVKSYSGHVKLDTILFNVAQDAIVYRGVGEAASTVGSGDKSMPRKMQLLEQLAQRAISDFFNKMP